MALRIRKLSAPALGVGLVLATLLMAPLARAHDPRQRVQVVSRQNFPATLSALRQAVTANRMGLVTQASAQAGAQALGVTIPGNQVWGIFHPRFAVRMLKASVAAGIEAPLRLYITEDAAGRVTVSYPTPSSVFAPYGNPELNAMAHELDKIFTRIVAAVQTGA